MYYLLTTLVTKVLRYLNCYISMCASCLNKSLFVLLNVIKTFNLFMCYFREYQERNISTNVYVVDSRWLYSLYWCAGVYGTTSDNAQYFEGWNGPAWYMVSLMIPVITNGC